ncbi:MAG TPA: NUDIX domain-containing protein [Pyrinomonadaceae bacterium]|jgi:8-oxo-dGTP pyrophosphatase MutT (NUDIX family)
MNEELTFGSPEPGVEYAERRAAYVVIIDGEGRVAMVLDRQRYFLPGGGAWAGETPEQTIAREVEEELARGVRLTRRLGDALQFYYSIADERHYRMHATFFSGQLTDEPRPDLTPEHELLWLPLDEAQRRCFHRCHAWAIERGQRSEVRGQRKTKSRSAEV